MHCGQENAKLWKRYYRRIRQKALLSTFSKSDRLIVKLYEAGVGQKHIAKKIGKTQSYVSKRLERLLDLIEAERLNDGSRTKKEIEFELAWKKFIYSHKMPKDIDVIFETFNYLIGERMLEELLIYFYSFREYYYYAYRLLYLYEYNPAEDNLGCINELPLIFRKIFYYQKLNEQADVFIWLYYCLVTEMERRKKITPEPNQEVYEQLLDEQEKTAKRVKMTSEQFMEERFIPKVAPLLKKRTDDFYRQTIFTFSTRMPTSKRNSKNCLEIRNKKIQIFAILEYIGCFGVYISERLNSTL